MNTNLFVITSQHPAHARTELLVLIHHGTNSNAGYSPPIGEFMIHTQIVCCIKVIVISAPETIGSSAVRFRTKPKNRRQGSDLYIVVTDALAIANLQSYIVCKMFAELEADLRSCNLPKIPVVQRHTGTG